MVRESPETTTVKDCVAVSGRMLATAVARVLVTCTVKVNVPAPVGVPDRIPPADKVVPVGRVPEASENV